MKPMEDLEKQLKQVPVKLNADVDEVVFADLCNRLVRGQGVRIAFQGVMPTLGRLAIASVLTAAVFLSISQLGASVDGTSVAWADVLRHIEQVDYLHFYLIETEQNGHSSIREGWYAHGKIKIQQYDAEQTIDNGKHWVVIDEHNNIIKKGKSDLTEYENVYDALSKDMLSYRFSQFNDKTPVSVGSDFLIYEFDPPEDKDEWVDKVTVTVGRNSLMPVQIKTYLKKADWSMDHLMVFDYEAREKPEAFFALPTLIRPPHGTGRLVLDGEEVVIELQNTRHIKKAIVRLQSESTDAALGEYEPKAQQTADPAAFLEITFITDENDRSDKIIAPIWLDKGIKGISKIARTTPHEAFYYILYTPILRATDANNTFNLELSCWLKTKKLDK